MWCHYVSCWCNAITSLYVEAQLIFIYGGTTDIHIWRYSWYSATRTSYMEALGGSYLQLLPWTSNSYRTLGTKCLLRCCWSSAHVVQHCCSSALYSTLCIQRSVACWSGAHVAQVLCIEREHLINRLFSTTLWSKETPTPGGVFYVLCSLIKSRV